MRNRKRNFFNPEDIYYRRKMFSKMHSGVYETDKVLDIISPLDHGDLMTCTHEQIRQNSKELMDKYCDKEKAFSRKKISEVTSQ